jgi:oxaloacetate decarboxylase alpha subunit/pyruvate carboxylase subunit B
MICQPAQDIALGKYGKTPGPIAPHVLEQVEKQTGKKTVTVRPADLLEPGLEKHRKQCAEKSLPTDDETVVLFAMFPQQVEALIKKPAAAAVPTVATTTAPSAPPPAAAAAPAASPAATTRPSNGSAQRLFVTVNGTRHSVTVETLEG